MKRLLRDKIEKHNINSINASIEAYTNMISFYEEYIEKHSNSEYIEERVHYLNSQLAEYMIAREISVEEKPYTGKK